MKQFFSFGAIALLVTAAPAADYKVKVVDKSEAPAELKDGVRGLMSDRCIQFLDGDKLLSEVWFRKAIPAKATDAQIKNGLTYQELGQTTLVGAVKIHEQASDYRKQKIKPGTYTLRLAFQPMDGDHMGTAPNNEFLILSPAAIDEGKDKMEPEALHKMGTRASNTGHPAVWLLFPAGKNETGKPPALVKKPDNHWVLFATQDVTVDGSKKAVIGIGLALVGVSPGA